MRRVTRSRPGQPKDVALHQARKAAKRARYAAEAVAPAIGGQATRFAKRMKRVQSALGDHQDAVISRQVARKLAIRAANAGENAFTYGIIYQRDIDAAGRAADKATRAWKAASRRRYRHWLAS